MPCWAALLLAVSEKGAGRGQGPGPSNPPPLRRRAAHGLPALLAEDILLQLGLTDGPAEPCRGPCGVLAALGRASLSPPVPSGPSSLIKLTLVVSGLWLCVRQPAPLLAVLLLSPAHRSAPLHTSWDEAAAACHWAGVRQSRELLRPRLPARPPFASAACLEAFHGPC